MFESVAVTQNSDTALVLSKEFLDIQITIECRFTLKRVRDMKRTCSGKESLRFLLERMGEQGFLEISLRGGNID